jgi:Leucine-rich repeat (LRR) protein
MLTHLSNLKTLDLYCNQLVKWNPCKDELFRLVNLSLTFNQFKFLPRRAFFGLSSLKNLDLSYNKIEVIENGAFDGLTNLNYLNLSENSFVSLDISVFNESDLPMLNKLDVHKFFLRANNTTVNFVNQLKLELSVDRVTNNWGSLIEKLASIGLFHLTNSNLMAIVT